MTDNLQFEKANEAVSKPTVGLVGRPNVGKSTLFNGLCRKKLAIVNEMPGVTRDSKAYTAQLGDIEFLAVDTAGWEENENELQQAMMDQTRRAIHSSDVILLLVDAKEGITSQDIRIAELVRAEYPGEVIVVLNKCEVRDQKIDLNDLYKLGLGDAVRISASQRLGLSELYVRLHEALSKISVPPVVETSSTSDGLLALVGRPNVGKSTIFNQIFGGNRMVVSSIAGTTRDSVTAACQLPNGDALSLIDTAGLRKRTKVRELGDTIEFDAVGQSISAIRRANVVALVMDATEPFTKQDLSIVHMVANEGKGLVVILNKIDLIEDMDHFSNSVQKFIGNYINFIDNIPVIYMSAISQIDLEELETAIGLVKKAHQATFSTSKLNKWLKEATTAHRPPLSANSLPVKFKYITQTATNPPTFKIFLNKPEEIRANYLKYLQKSIVSYFNLVGTPVRIKVDKTDNPYEKK